LSNLNEQNKKWKKNLAIALLMICVLTQVGCSIIEKKTSTQPQTEEVEESLWEKYKKSFSCIDEPYQNISHKYSIPDLYKATFCDWEEEDKKFGVIFNINTDEIRDNYPMVFFEDELEELAESMFSEDQMVEEHAITMEDGFTALDQIYTKEDSALEYFKEEGGHAKVGVSLKSGYTDLEYAKEIKSIYTELNNIYGNFYLEVGETGECIFQDDEEKQVGFEMSEEDILSRIEECRIKNKNMFIEDNRKISDEAS
jgi:hypothetical protein